MAEISAKAVKDLREQTGAGMMDCKRALTEAEGDLERALAVLRERGLAKAGKREGRETSEGMIAVSMEGPVGGMVELGCETDFVARTDDFAALGSGLAALVASADGPQTPEELAEASTDGQRVADRISESIAKLGENIVIKRVARLEVKDGLVGGYVHAGAKLGVLVGVEGAADAAELARDVAMHVAAADPTPVAVFKEDIAEALLDTEREIYRNQAVQEGKPEKVLDRIVEGKIKKYLKDICLVEQSFVKDPDRNVGSLLDEAGARVSGFARFKLGQSGEEATPS
ncbi:MAG: translation elongation factor Ts [Myxococcales bacterium]|nr:translation elongation factor Ts [Myxococcales bacterium]